MGTSGNRGNIDPDNLYYYQFNFVNAMSDKKNDLTWSFYEIWNKSLGTRAKRPPQSRDVIWASELGGSMVDRYLKMTGVKPTNPPNKRSLRKFEAGNLMEWVVKMVLIRAGIFISTQKWVKHQYPQSLQVNGKIDQLAGGVPDLDKAKDEINNLELPEFFASAAERIVKHLIEKYPNGLKNIVLEIKSCSSFMFEVYEKTGANKNHEMQAFHYLKAERLPEAHIVYISKDDLRMLEIGIFNTPKFEEPYKKDIEQMTGYFKAKEQPPLEKEITFDRERQRFSTNWKVAYSSYLTKLYGFKNQKGFDDKYKGKIASFNRVVGRMRDNKNMTPLNLEVIKEMQEWEPDIKQIIHEENGA